MDSGQIILFQTQGGETKIEVRLATLCGLLTTRWRSCFNATNQLLQDILGRNPLTEAFEAEQKKLR